MNVSLCSFGMNIVEVDLRFMWGPLPAGFVVHSQALL